MDVRKERFRNGKPVRNEGGIKLRKAIGWLCIVLAIAIFAVTAKTYWPKFMDYKKARDLYDDLESKYATKPVDDDEDESEEKIEDLAEEERLRALATGNPEAEGEASLPPIRPSSADDESWFEQTEELSEDARKKERTPDDETRAETETETETETEIKSAKRKSRVREIKSERDILRETFAKAGLDLKPGAYRSLDVDGAGLLKENEDYVGWIYVPKTKISYPVVQGKDNSEYLHANFKKEYNYPGTIFMDALCKKGILNHHGILYGHNMRDGSMFAETKNYLDQKFLDEHPVFWFITPKYKLLYLAFSAYEANPKDEDAFAIQGMDFKTNEEWLKVIENLQKKSAVKRNYEPDARDFTLTLSTCTNARTTRVVTTGVLLGAMLNEDGKTPTGKKTTKKVGLADAGVETETESETNAETESETSATSP